MRARTQTTPGGVRHDPTLFSETLSEALARGEAVLFRPQGVSMLPWLRAGRQVRVRPAAGHILRRGDIALYWREPGRPVLHRVVRVRRAEGVCECRGDSESGEPERVPLAAVVGVVATPVLGRLVYLALHPARRSFNRFCLRWGLRLRHG